jgi:hypothetical protein
MGQLIKILTLIVLATGTSCSQDYKLTDFVETKMPKGGSDEWFELNHSRNEFKVSVDKEVVKISKVGQGSNAFLEIDGGQLIGTDRGEWGGMIEFLPKGTKEKKLIKEGNVNFIFSYKNQIYFMEGLAHLSINEGAMYRLDINKGMFSYEKVIEFEDAPEAIAVVGDSIFIASHKSFFLVNNLNKELVFKDLFWSGLYPNSIAIIDNKNIYVGHRGGFTKLDIDKKEIHFFKFK